MSMLSCGDVNSGHAPAGCINDSLSIDESVSKDDLSKLGYNYDNNSSGYWKTEDYVVNEHEKIIGSILVIVKEDRIKKIKTSFTYNGDRTKDLKNFIRSQIDRHVFYKEASEISFREKGFPTVTYIWQ